MIETFKSWHKLWLTKFNEAAMIANPNIMKNKAKVTYSGLCSRESS